MFRSESWTDGSTMRTKKVEGKPKKTQDRSYSDCSEKSTDADYSLSQKRKGRNESSNLVSKIELSRELMMQDQIRAATSRFCRRTMLNEARRDVR